MKYTDEQLEFLRAGWKKMGLPELTAAFNATFDMKKFPCQIRSTLKNHRFLSGRDGRFVKGERVPGSGAKGPNATSFKAGRLPQEAMNYLPIGSTRISKDGYMERKVTDDPSLVPARRWAFEHRLVWEAAHGPIPEGHAVVFLDGDRANITLDNLRCVPRGTLQWMNKTGLNETTGEARKAAILTAELVTRANQRARA